MKHLEYWIARRSAQLRIRRVTTAEIVLAAHCARSRILFGCTAENLIHHNSEPAVECILHRRQNAAASRYQPGGRTRQQRRDTMTVAQQAFLFTGEIFVLSFVAIYAMWFVDRLLRNFLR